MSYLARRVIPAFLLVLVAACVSNSGTRNGASAVRAALPPSDYIFLSSADLSEGKDIQIGVTPGFMGKLDDRDSRLMLMFGFAFATAALDAKPSDAATVGNGLSVTDPIRLSPPVTANAELDTVLSVLATRAPDRDNIIGHLYHSPDQRYLALIEFDTRAGANSLYFDVTNWANHAAEN
jgi:hypothetical protein